MSDAQIVSCPGCAKRYSVPGGVPPGQFQCQDCSAVVVYGRGGAAAGGNGPPRAAEAPPRGGKPAGGSAKSHSKAAAAKRKTARSRRDEEEDEDDRPARGGPKKKDSSVYLMAIAGAVVFVVIAIVVIVQMNKGKAKPAPAPAAPGAATPDKGVGTFNPLDEPEAKPAPAPAPAPAPTPAPTPRPAPVAAKDDGAAEPKLTGGIKTTLKGGVTDKADTFTPAANPPTGSHYGMNQAALLLMLREKHSEAWVDPGHLPDTPADLAQKIDADVAKIADVNGGSDAFRAADRLIKIGRPAIPKVVGLLSRLDFSKYSSMQEARDACVVGDAIDHVLRDITGYDKITQLQYSPLDGKLSQYTQSLDEWCVWWFTIGYKRETFYKKEGAAEEEKL